MRYAIEYTAGNGKRYTEYADTPHAAEATRARIIRDYAAIPGMSAHADGVTITAASEEPNAPHAPAPDRGRNVHCVCGAEFSHTRSLMAHITVENIAPEYTGDGGGRYVSADAPGTGNYFRGAHDAYNGEG